MSEIELLEKLIEKADSIRFIMVCIQATIVAVVSMLFCKK